jgi:hypothetical protein
MLSVQTGSVFSEVNALIPKLDSDSPDRTMVVNARRSIDDIPLPVFIEKTGAPVSVETLYPKQESKQKTAYRVLAATGKDMTPLSDRSISELTKMAKGLGIEFVPGMNKREIINKIRTLESSKQ